MSTVLVGGIVPLFVLAVRILIQGGIPLYLDIVASHRAFVAHHGGDGHREAVLEGGAGRGDTRPRGEPRGTVRPPGEIS